MPASFLLRLASLFLLIALGAPATTATAASLFGRGGSKGRPTLHRPNYKHYNAHQSRWFFQRW